MSVPLSMETGTSFSLMESLPSVTASMIKVCMLIYIMKSTKVQEFMLLFAIQGLRFSPETGRVKRIYSLKPPMPWTT